MSPSTNKPPRPVTSSSNCSTGSGSYNGPSSVTLVQPSPLARELSDLSGSYMNGNTAPRSGHRSVLSHSNSMCSNEESVRGCWRQAHILSVPCPVPREQQQRQQPLPSPALIVEERNGVIELIKKTETGDSNTEMEDQGVARQKTPADADDLLFLAHASASSSSNSGLGQARPSQHSPGEEHARTPILILLLDPGRKQFEIMQLWVDIKVDLVRDVLHSIQRKLPEKWRQDYDGLMQLRGSSFCQLVHIFNIAKYDVRPRELWVAKPWSMAAKSAADLARDCIKELRADGLLSVHTDNDLGNNSKLRLANFFSKGSSSGRSSPAFHDDAPLTLSRDAMNRLHIPDGSFMNHHHAHQFLSFRAPAPPPREVGAPPRSSHQHRFFGSLLGTSNSFDDVSSQLSNPSEAMLPIFETDADSDTVEMSGSPLRSKEYNPNRNRHPREHRGYSTKYSSLNGPALPAVGEVGSSRSLNKNNGNSNSNSSTPCAVSNYSLADLDVTKETESFTTSLIEYLKKKKTLLFKKLKPLNCTSCRRSKKGIMDDDGYSSVLGGQDARSSSAAKSEINSEDGRDTPTSKGSAGEESLQWHTPTAEDGSIVSESAPLLLCGLGSSSCTSPASIQHCKHSRNFGHF